MADPLTSFGIHTTVQTQSVPGVTQIKNAAGGYVFETSPLQRIERFLILGTWGGTYYTSEKDLTRDNAELLIQFVNSGQDNAIALIDLIRSVSLDGRAHKQNPTLFALAVACSFGTPESKRYALASISDVCRTGTMLFQFVQYVEQFRGHGRALNRELGEWYTKRSVGSLQNQLVKYQSRGGWSNRDVLRLARPKPADQIQANAFAWATDKRPVNEIDLTGLNMIAAFEALKVETNIDQVVQIINQAQLPWEAVPSQHLRDPKVWEALLPHLGLTAALRNLGRMSNIGYVVPNSDAAKVVVDKITNAENIAAQRVHPMQVLLALVTYRAGCGKKGDLTWTPVARVLDALEEAFYMSFGNVPSTGKRRMLALDTSGSMGSPFGGTFLRSCEATAAMAMVAVRTEEMDVYTKYFSAGSGGSWSRNSVIGDLAFTPKTNLAQAVEIALEHNWGSTDCSLPMTWALENKVPVDTFEVYTDNETYAGRIHPFQALRQYRDKMGIDAKMIVVATTSTPFSIADPNDPGMMDFVGFDASAPAAISYFITS